MTMSTNRNAAIALVTGSLAGLVTMALHPTGRDVVHNASAGMSNTDAGEIAGNCCVGTAGTGWVTASADDTGSWRGSSPMATSVQTSRTS